MGKVKDNDQKQRELEDKSPEAERTQMKILHREEKDFYTSIINGTPAIICGIDPDGTTTFINSAGLTITGYNAEELIGENWWTILYPGDEYRQVEQLFRNLKNGNIRDYEMTLTTRDGKKRTISWNSLNRLDKDGNIIQIIGFGNDITDRKRAEEVLLKNDRLLRRAEDVAKFGNWEFLLDENKVLASKGARDIYGLENEELRISDVKNIPLPGYRPMLDRALKDLIELGTPYNVEFEICRPTDGKIIHIHSIAEYDATEKVVFGVIQDITERMRTEKERDALQAQLLQAQKMESVGRLAGGVAHDFNNILTAIIGYCSMAQINLKDDPTTRGYIQEVLDAATRAEDLTKRLLVFSRKQVIEPMLADLNEIVRNIEKMLQRIMTEDIELSTVLSAGELPVLVDVGQIDQVLVNLAANARDAMPEGGHLVIQTDAVNVNSRYAEEHFFENTGMYAVLTVSDTGVGMDQWTKENMFEPFFTTKEVGKGTGLGLSMVYGIIEQHNGNIKVCSDAGRGTTFKIYLPLAQTKRKTIHEPVQTLPVGKGETIILAEDESQVRKSMTSILQKNGYRIIEAVNGEDAVRKFKENIGAVSLVLLDVIMPLKNGREAHEEIKGIDPGIKTIFMSGYTDDIISKDGILEEGFDFVSKPINPDALMRKIRDVLDM
ncbi:MAG: PAS domain S-box protein [Dissulfurispiraceae bacterium]